MIFKERPDCAQVHSVQLHVHVHTQLQSDATDSQHACTAARNDSMHVCNGSDRTCELAVETCHQLVMRC